MGARAAMWTVAASVLLALPSGVQAQGPLSALDSEMEEIARAARSSVVTVIAQSSRPVRNPRKGEPLTRAHIRVGSGVAVEEGSILTTASVILDAEHVWLRTTNGLQVEARIAGFDPIFNIALLKASGVRLPTLKFSTQRPAREGEWVMAIGTSSYQAQITESVGNIAYRYREPGMSLLQLTNTVYPGYSGGAVLNARGELIGIVQGELSPSQLTGFSEAGRTSGGASFIVPVETVLPVYLALRTEGRVHHGYLGVTTRAASVESEAERGSQVPIGALVESAQADGPAAHAGITRGDLIVAFEGERVEYPEQLARWVAATSPGTAVDLVWVHDELQRNGKAVLSTSPEAIPRWALYPQTAESSPSAARIDDLKRQIRQLNHEIDRLKTENPR
jgi:serine protease Do